MPRIERAATTGRAGWLTIAGILLVPLAVGGLLLAGLWKPADRLEQVTAAIVNDDEPVELDGGEAGADSPRVAQRPASRVVDADEQRADPP